MITTLAGITGVSLGSTLSARLGKRYAQADPLICAGGMVFSVPLLFLGAVFAHRLPNMSWVSVPPIEWFTETSPSFPVLTLPKTSRALHKWIRTF